MRTWPFQEYHPTPCRIRPRSRCGHITGGRPEPGKAFRLKIGLQGIDVGGVSEKRKSKRKKAHDGSYALVNSTDIGLAEDMKEVSKKSLVGFRDNVVVVERLRCDPLVCRVLIVELQNLVLGVPGDGSGDGMILHDGSLIQSVDGIEQMLHHRLEKLMGTLDHNTVGGSQDGTFCRLFEDVSPSVRGTGAVEVGFNQGKNPDLFAFSCGFSVPADIHKGVSPSEHQFGGPEVVSFEGLRIEEGRTLLRGLHRFHVSDDTVGMLRVCTG